MVYAPVRPDPSLPPVRVNLFSDTQTRPSAGHEGRDDAGRGR